MPRVVHFEIHAKDGERAVEFYTGVFGWTVEKWNGPVDYWMLTTGKGEPGIDGAVTLRGDPPEATVNTIEVDSVDEYIGKAVQYGGTIILPKMPVPGVGWIAYCKDTEGNTFGLMQADPNAK